MGSFQPHWMTIATITILLKVETRLWKCRSLRTTKEGRLRFPVSISTKCLQWFNRRLDVSVWNLWVHLVLPFLSFILFSLPNPCVNMLTSMYFVSHLLCLARSVKAKKRRRRTQRPAQTPTWTWLLNLSCSSPPASSTYLRWLISSCLLHVWRTSLCTPQLTRSRHWRATGYGDGWRSSGWLATFLDFVLQGGDSGDRPHHRWVLLGRGPFNPFTSRFEFLLIRRRRRWMSACRW